MKPAVDEMFPEGAGPYVDLDEVSGARCPTPEGVPTRTRPGGLHGGAVGRVQGWPLLPASGRLSLGRGIWVRARGGLGSALQAAMWG